MTKKLSLAIRELYDSLAYIGLFVSLFDAIVLFALSILVLYVLNLSWLFAFFVVVPYIFIHTRTNLKRLNLKFVESKVPEVKEELRTCADTKNVEDNEVVKLLHEDLLHKMKKIRTSYFLSLGRLSRQLFFLAVICFLIVAAAAYDFRIFDVPKSIDDLSKVDLFGGGSKGGDTYLIDESLLDYEEMDEDADIFGNKSVAELGNKELLLEINPLMSDVDISKISDPDRNKDFRSVPPADIGATTDASYEESIPKQYQRIIKRYFNEISKNN